MKKLILLFTVVTVFASCNTKDEIPCDCNRILDKRPIVLGNGNYDFEFQVEDCLTIDTAWTLVTQDEFNNNGIGDCWN